MFRSDPRQAGMEREGLLHKTEAGFLAFRGVFSPHQSRGTDRASKLSETFTLHMFRTAGFPHFSVATGSPQVQWAQGWIYVVGALVENMQGRRLSCGEICRLIITVPETVLREVSILCSLLHWSGCCALSVYVAAWLCASPWVLRHQRKQRTSKQARGRFSSRRSRRGLMFPGVWVCCLAGAVWSPNVTAGFYSSKTAP